MDRCASVLWKTYHPHRKQNHFGWTAHLRNSNSFRIDLRILCMWQNSEHLVTMRFLCRNIWHIFHAKVSYTGKKAERRESIVDERKMGEIRCEGRNIHWIRHIRSSKHCDERQTLRTREPTNDEKEKRYADGTNQNRKINKNRIWKEDGSSTKKAPEDRRYIQTLISMKGHVASQ